MDWTSLILALGILLYGILEYLKRESLQKQRIEGLRKGILPSFEPPVPQIGRILTTGGVEAALVVFSGWLWYRGIVPGNYIRAYAPLGVFFTALAIIVLVMLVNQIGRYRRKA